MSLFDVELAYLLAGFSGSVLRYCDRPVFRFSRKLLGSYSIRVGGAMRNLVNVALISAAKADVVL